MSNLDTDTDTSPSIRDALEGAVATHSVSPDVESIVNGAKEADSRDIRTRSETKSLDRFQSEAENVAHRRTATREAINEAKQKAARGPAEARTEALPGKSTETRIGPPASWDKAAQALWHNLPQEVRLATQRGEETYKTAIESHPHIKEYQAIDQQLAPLREMLVQNGIRSPSQAVGKLLEWEGRFRNPQTRMQAFQDLAREYQVNLGGMPQGQEQRYVTDNVTPEMSASATREVASFSQGRPHFEQVRETMGNILSARGAKYLRADGSVNLDAIYRDACKIDGIGAAPAPPSQRPRALLPSRPPAASKPNATVRESLLAAARRTG